MKIKEPIIKLLTPQNIYTSFKTNEFTNNLYIYNNEENIKIKDIEINSCHFKNIDFTNIKVEVKLDDLVLTKEQAQEELTNLKGQNVFDKEAQKKAFEMTYNKVMNILTEEAKEYLAEVYGDLDIYITSKIESEVNFFKKDVGII